MQEVFMNYCRASLTKVMAIPPESRHRLMRSACRKSANKRHAKRGSQLRRARALPIYGTATLTVSSKIFTPSPSRIKSAE
jgi:hypothetical protein